MLVNNIMNSVQDKSWLEKFLLVRYIREMEEDVNLHKWFQSEKAGHDVGWDKASVDWAVHISRRFYREHPADIQIDRARLKSLSGSI